VLSWFAADVSGGVSAEVFGAGNGSEFVGSEFSVAVGQLLAVVGSLCARG
jgi:hypothetical protein